MGKGIFLEYAGTGFGVWEKGMGKQYIPSRTRASGKLRLVYFLSLLFIFLTFNIFLGVFFSPFLSVLDMEFLLETIPPGGK